MSDFFEYSSDDLDEVGNNAPPELSVSDLSNRLKQLVEDEFSYVRVRGELSRVTMARSGHMYTSLKDDKSVLDAICWKGSVAKLSMQPEEGLEVICTGRLTTYPGRSNYQLIIDTMEMAGEGALLKMLEDRRKKLAAEGLFDESRKKKIPLLPERIGVVTSQTGAVIRDILHRLEDRFPRHVLLWPVIVQGKGADQRIVEGIEGFNALPEEYRPDLIIVARGGGSLEDLMAFNEEIVVRAVANSEIPLISAIGHETDTTLIDYVSDLRAPTPTGAAEKAVPMRSELLSLTMDNEHRLYHAMQRRIEYFKNNIQGLERGLGNPARLLETVTQKLDHMTSRLFMGLDNWIERKDSYLKQLSVGLTPQLISQNIQSKSQYLSQCQERLGNASKLKLQEQETKLQHLSMMLNSLSFERVLDRGFALIRDDAGQAVTSVDSLSSGQIVDITLSDGRSQAEILDNGEPKKPSKAEKKKPEPVKKDKEKAPSKKIDQGSLF